MIKDVLLKIVEPYLMDGYTPTEDSVIARDFGFDSIDIVDIIIDIEEDLDIEIAESEIKELITIRDLINLIELKLEEKKSED